SFFRDPSPPPIYTLSLHDALPICRSQRRLNGTVWSLVLTVSALVAGAIGVSVFQPSPADPGLADRVRAFRDQPQQRHASERLAEDRKSTRLNSSHDQISYAVFCLK